MPAIAEESEESSHRSSRVSRLIPSEQVRPDMQLSARGDQSLRCPKCGNKIIKKKCLQCAMDAYNEEVNADQELFDATNAIIDADHQDII